MIYIRLALPWHGLWDLSSLPDQGSNPDPLQWKLGVLKTGPPGKFLTVSGLNISLQKWRSIIHKTRKPGILGGCCQNLFGVMTSFHTETMIY